MQGRHAHVRDGIEARRAVVRRRLTTKDNPTTGSAKRVEEMIIRRKCSYIASQEIPNIFKLNDQRYKATVIL